MDEKFIEVVKINGKTYEKWQLGYNQTSVGYTGCEICNLDGSKDCLKGDCLNNDFFYVWRKQQVFEFNGKKYKTIGTTDTAFPNSCAFCDARRAVTGKDCKGICKAYDAAFLELKEG